MSNPLIASPDHPCPQTGVSLARPGIDTKEANLHSESVVASGGFDPMREPLNGGGDFAPSA